MDQNEPKFKAAFNRILFVGGIVCIVAYVVVSIIVIVSFGWGAFAIMAVITAYLILPQALADLPEWFENQKLRRRARNGQCLKCGYDLRGSRESKVCPECGEPIATLKS